MRFTTGTSAPARLSTASSCSRAASRSTSRSRSSRISAPAHRASKPSSASRRRPTTRAAGLADVAGLGWLGLLHASKAIERGRPWEATYWIGSVRDQTLTLAVPARREPALPRGADGLPTGITAPLEETLVLAPRAGELRRALRAAGSRACSTRSANGCPLAERLEGALAGG